MPEVSLSLAGVRHVTLQVAGWFGAWTGLGQPGSAAPTTVLIWGLFVRVTVMKRVTAPVRCVRAATATIHRSSQHFPAPSTERTPLSKAFLFVFGVLGAASWRAARHWRRADGVQSVSGQSPVAVPAGAAVIHRP